MRFLRTTVVFVIALSSLASASSSEVEFHFGSATFKKEMWINNRAVFKRPKSVDVEFVTPGAFDWVFADPTGKEIRTLHHKNEHGGWTSIDFASLGLFGDFSIGFRNASAGEKEIKQGDVHLK